MHVSKCHFFNWEPYNYIFSALRRFLPEHLWVPKWRPTVSCPVWWCTSAAGSVSRGPCAAGWRTQPWTRIFSSCWSRRRPRPSRRTAGRRWLRPQRERRPKVSPRAAGRGWRRTLKKSHYVRGCYWLLAISVSFSRERYINFRVPMRAVSVAAVCEKIASTPITSVD